MPDTNLLFALRNRLNFDPGGGSTAFLKVPTTSMIALFFVHILVVCDAFKFVLANNASEFDGLSNSPFRLNFPGREDGDTGGGELFHNSAAATPSTGEKRTGYAYDHVTQSHGHGEGDATRFASDTYLSRKEPRNIKLLQRKNKFNDFHQSSGQESRTSTTLPQRLSVSNGGTLDSRYIYNKSLISVFRNQYRDAVSAVLMEKRILFQSSKHDIRHQRLYNYKTLRKILTTGNPSTQNPSHFFSKLRPHEEDSQKALIRRHRFRRQADGGREGLTPPSGSSAVTTTHTLVEITTTLEPTHTSVHQTTTATPGHTSPEVPKHLPPKPPVTKGWEEGATSEGGNGAKHHTDVVRASSASQAGNGSDGGGGMVDGCFGSQCYASRFPYHWTSDASWALGSILFLLCLLTFFVLYTGLWKKRNPMSYPFDGSTLPNPNRKVNIAELLKTRLAMIPKHLRPKRHRQKRYEEIPLRPPNGAAVEDEDDDDFFDDEEEDLYFRDQHLV